MLDEVTDNDERGALSDASIVDVLRAEAKEIAEAKDVYIPIVGFERSGLACHYLLPDSGKELDSIARKVNREEKDNFKRNLLTAIDTMIHLCEGFYVRSPEAEDYVQLDPDSTGQALTYEPRLAEVLGIPDVTSARSVVRHLFGKNDMAIMNHAEKLGRWMSNTKADISTELWQIVGEQ